MPEAIRTITDKSQFQDIFYAHFMQGDSFIKTANGNLKVAFLGYTDGEAAFRIPFLKNMPDMVLVMTRSEGATVYAALKSREKQEDEVYTFIPLKMQIIYVERSAERRRLDADSSKSLIFVTHVISDFIIEKTIALEPRKVERIKFAVLSEMEQIFPHRKVYLVNEGMSDPRMKYFYDMGAPYLITNVTDQKQRSDEVWRSYMENIYSKDYFLINRKNFISEVAVPVLYRNTIPFGYVQVNSTVPANDAMLMMVRKLAAVTGELFNRQKLFQLLEEKLLVSDVSVKGLSIVFRDRKYIRYFKEKSYLNFNLNTGSDEINMLVIVRNVGLMENKIIKVGCEILRIQQGKEEVYAKFVNG